jgi:hypothetical protein
MDVPRFHGRPPFPDLFLVCGICYFGLQTYLKYENPIGYENLRKCEQMAAGITFSEIVEILGIPRMKQKPRMAIGITLTHYLSLPAQ